MSSILSVFKTSILTVTNEILQITVSVLCGIFCVYTVFHIANAIQSTKYNRQKQSNVIACVDEVSSVQNQSSNQSVNAITSSQHTTNPIIGVSNNTGSPKPSSPVITPDTSASSSAPSPSLTSLRQQASNKFNSKISKVITRINARRKRSPSSSVMDPREAATSSSSLVFSSSSSLSKAVGITYLKTLKARARSSSDVTNSRGSQQLSPSVFRVRPMRNNSSTSASSILRQSGSNTPQTRASTPATLRSRSVSSIQTNETLPQDRVDNNTNTIGSDPIWLTSNNGEINLDPPPPYTLNDPMGMNDTLYNSTGDNSSLSTSSSISYLGRLLWNERD
ncbi:hypothetical protein KGF56_001504 [Candida oxycetoniae]|uniref:Uncharacterized protein n=1 Tax=Candida oxycetoniae TaxID=497107 RepID=A0AAI9WYL3_9ASCO|nr:uncharacterized protein KGF56_001504 [Candida oxycetoniae]KAI3405486.2 hypothetical protein KGF56_001504 [Candida oxycetoniae]